MEEDLQKLRLDIATAMERARAALEDLKKQLDKTPVRDDDSLPFPPSESEPPLVAR
jgi:hypothetical protein